MGCKCHLNGGAEPQVTDTLSPDCAVLRRSLAIDFPAGPSARHRPTRGDVEPSNGLAGHVRYLVLRAESY